MSIFNYIVDSILQYSVKRKIKQDPEIQQIDANIAKLKKELEVIKQRNQKSIEDFWRKRDEAEARRPKTMRIENGQIFDDNGILRGLIKGDTIDFINNLPAKFEKGKVYFYLFKDEAGNELGEILATIEIMNNGEIYIKQGDDKRLLTNIKEVRRAILGECKDVIKVATHVFMTNIYDPYGEDD